MKSFHKFDYKEIGVCGLSCRLCPAFHRITKSKCYGCKSEDRIKVGCSFIRCAVKKKGLDFCYLCEDNRTCEKWKKHRMISREHDSFVCYQKLEDNLAFIESFGLESFEKDQIQREHLLKVMLGEFNDGRSKSYYCIAATVLKLEELENAIKTAKERSVGLDLKSKSKILHSILDQIASDKKYSLKLRK